LGDKQKSGPPDQGWRRNRGGLVGGRLNEEGAKSIASRADSLWHRSMFWSTRRAYHHVSTERPPLRTGSVLKVNVIGTSFLHQARRPYDEKAEKRVIINIASSMAWCGQR